ncbi:MAG: DUF1800 domain-containing protein [Chloroflexi bacterium]|nr:MAG: DUF1800 domain-containing protein [Chloroflexota bacterium]
MSTASLRLSRRQALGLAVGGAAGAAGLRLASLHLSGSPSASVSAAGAAGAWASPLGTSRGLAAHLLRRAGFGYTDAELDAAASMSYPELVDRMVSQAPQAPAQPPRMRTDYRAVSSWWYTHMATTTAQFPERMTLFWHGLLTSDFRKSNRFPYIYQQNQLYRRLGTGDLRSLLLAATYDPAMMRYLDLDQSTARAPNENFSRELMELFTLGVGNFSEQDVREGARALSGLRIVLVDAQGQSLPLPRRQGMTPQQYYAQLEQLAQSGAAFKGVLTPRLHDGGSKSYLGRTGNIGPEQAVDAILAQDACAVHIATKALEHLCSANPSNDLVTRVAGQFRGSGYDIRTLVRAILTSDEFTAAANYRSLVRSPADYVVATMRALGQPDLAAQAVTAGAGMGQVLYDPPTVAGWPSNGAWLSSSTLLARVNFAQTVVNRGGSLPDPATAVRNQLDGVVGPDTAAVLNGSQSTADRWYALLASPEFHLK